MRVVEPQDYEPGSHAEIFTRVVTQLISPQQAALSGYGAEVFVQPEPFDLVVFPEAFAPTSALLDVLRSLKWTIELGCVHVGLRSDHNLKQHLLSKAEILRLVQEIRGIPQALDTDLDHFTDWLGRQRNGELFNIACLFSIDADRRLRVCLHPKMVRSQVEASALPERNMTEADLLTLVTLHPANKAFFTVTLQPLICSDALSLKTDRATGSALEELQREANIFKAPPDHVDIVTVATCSPQKVAKPPSRDPYREWHDDFRTAFERAAQHGELARHHYATFVLSNFRTLADDKPGGLSGLFEPIDPGSEILPHGLTMSCYGKDKADANNRWSTPLDALGTWKRRGYIAALEPETSDSDTAVTIFGFTLPSLLRDNSPWKPRRSVTSCEVTVARWSEGRGLTFSTMDSRL